MVRRKSVMCSRPLLASVGVLALAALSALGSLEVVTAAAADAGTSEDRPWWKDAVIYQIYPRSFKDSDGDGTGDLEGIRSKLEHLKEIGVNAVWLSPIYPSPQKDFGYDISDYKNVDPQYGTMEDFKKLKDRAHELGLRLILDIVPNHSSNEHEWFKKSENGSFPEYRDLYVWRKAKVDAEGNRSPPNNWNSVFRGPAWTWSDIRQEYYLHQFAKEQPDLNYNNTKIHDEMKDVFRFWIDQGVDGFRIDAVPYLYESCFDDEPLSGNPDTDDQDNDYHTHTCTKDRPETYEIIQEWREVVDNYKNPDKKISRVMMTEAYASLDDTIRYYGTKEKPGAHFTFNFELLSHTNKTTHAKHFKEVIDTWMSKMEDWRWPNWLIGNHDSSRVATRYPELADGMNMLILTLPGTAMCYNGEELGMTDGYLTWEETLDPQACLKGKEKYEKVSRDTCRTPFQWDDTTSAGFSTNATTWLPVNPNYWEINVKNEKDAKKSHFSIYKDLTAARKNEALRRGDLSTAVVGHNGDVLRVTRSLGKGMFVTLINFGSSEVKLDQSAIGEGTWKIYTSSMNSPLEKGSPIKDGLTLGPKASVLLTNSAGTTMGSLLLIAICVLIRW